MINITPIHAFNDNFIWAITDENACHLVLVDPGQAAPCIEFIERNQSTLSAILITHHHRDHVGGIEALLAHCKKEVVVYGPANEDIPYMNKPLSEGDIVNLPEFNLSLNVLDVPGHTAGHIVYHNDDTLFCGDTLFSGGCGRLFEGTPQQMHNSLSKLSALPANTKVYCAHEYTLANLHFALAVESENPELVVYFHKVSQCRENNVPTIPTTIAQEKLINPFLRCHEPSIIESAREYTGSQLSTDEEVFAAIRQWKDNF